MPFGPDGAVYSGIGVQNVLIGSMTSRWTKKDKWRLLVDDFPHIASRTNDNFFGGSTSQAQTVPPVETAAIDPIVFATTAPDFSLDGLLVSGKAPRPTQVCGFVEALLRDILVVMPTGSGKTLVAAMVMQRMRQLNPTRLAIMVVDRIPLVFQQGAAIEADTNLRVCCLCGENKTQATVQRLQHNHFDALVVTAGLLVEAAAKGELDPTAASVVVFDECHHAGSDKHDYGRLLQLLISDRGPSPQPRIVGLSASLIRAATMASARTDLLRLRDRFAQAVVYRPELPPAHQQVKWRVVASSHLDPGSMRIEREIREAVDRVNDLLTPQLRIMAIELHGVLRGALRSIRNQHAPEAPVQAAVERTMRALSAMEVFDLLGPAEAYKDLGWTTPVSSSSARYRALMEELVDCTPSARVLVFVATRAAAAHLHARLCVEFPDMHPRRVVGHGGWDGMDWMDGQQAAIAALSSGETRLLVCTSVLEEGLDISACDLVVRFVAGTTSLIQFVQSRGRARSVNGRLVMILSEVQRDRIRKLESEERMMDAVIAEMAVADPVPSARAKALASGLLLVDYSDHPIAQPDATVLYPTLLLFIEGPILDPVDIQTAISDVIRDLALASVQRIECVSGGASRHDRASSPRTFSAADSVVLVTLETLATMNCFERLCDLWDFRVQGEMAWAQPVDPSHPPLSESPSVESAVPVLENAVLAVGAFVSRQSFDHASDLGGEWSVEYAKPDRVVRLTSKSTRIEFSPGDIGASIMLTSDSSSRTATAFVHLKSPPTIFTALVGDWQRCCANLARPSPTTSLVDALARHPVLMIRVPLGQRKTLTALLQDTVGAARMYHTRITVSHRSRMQIDLDVLRSSRDADQVAAAVNRRCQWALAVLRAVRLTPFVEMGDIATAAILDQMAAASSTNTLLAIAATLELLPAVVATKLPWDNCKLVYDSYIQRLTAVAGPEGSDWLFEHPPPPGYVLVERVVITPTRIVPLPKVAVKSSRMLRKLPALGARLVIVSFREEIYQKLQDSTALDAAGVIVSSGFELGGVRFRFLCAGASQARDASAYFVQASGTDEVHRLRDAILPSWRHLPNASARLSRLGLFCTSDSTVEHVLGASDVGQIDDIFNAKGVILTDGAGLIDASFLRSILTSEASAIQVRLGGLKGVLVASLGLASRTGKLIQFRPSMRKCSSDHLGLGIVKVAGVSPLRLNRDMLNLLSSLHDAAQTTTWDLKGACLGLQDRELARLAQVLVNSDTASEILDEATDSSVASSAHAAGVVNLITDPFWRSLLRAVYRRSVRAIQRKTQVPVGDHGCLAMGVPDSSGSLGPEEIFLQIGGQNGGPLRIITGDVLFYRNPCTHPGDLRVVVAVDRPALHSMVDVVVLPVARDGFSLSAACSGGDLDGDMFACVWDVRLVPPRSVLWRTPLDYDGVLARARLACREPPPDTIEEMFTRIMSNDTIGRVARLHLALCDTLDSGATDPLAIALAEQQALAVDYPKTGVLPRVPDDPRVGKSYPDFMEYAGVKTTHVSNKLLGVMYRCCKRTTGTLGMEYDLEDGSGKLQLSPLQEYRPFMSDTHRIYSAYCADMAIQIARFGVNHEIDFIMAEPPTGVADRGRAAAAMRAAWAAMRATYRDQFFTSLPDIAVERRAKAAAWYVTATSTPKNQGRCASFAWLVVGDVLIEAAASSTSTSEDSAASSIGRSALQTFQRRLLPAVLSTTNAKASIPGTVQAATRSIDPGAILHTYGSFSTFLCTEDSDIDLLVLPSSTNNGAMSREWAALPQRVKDEDYLQRVVAIAIDPIALSKRIVLSSTVPIVTAEITTADAAPTRVDVSLCPDGWHKSRLILILYQHCPALWPLFALVLSWVRAVHLVRSSPSDEPALLKSGELHALVIALVCPPSVRPDDKPAPSLASLSSCLFANRRESSSNLGQLLMLFFARGAEITGPWQFQWPVPGAPVHELDADTVTDVSGLCARALHALAYHQSWELAMLHMATPDASSLRIRLSDSLSRSIDSAVEFHTARLAMVSGAGVHISRESDRRLVVHGTGSRGAINVLRDEVTALKRLGTLVAFGLPRQRVSAYFLDGSTFIRVGGDLSLETRLRFVPYTGPTHARHALVERAVPRTMTPIESQDNGAFARDWAAHAVHQLQSVASSTATASYVDSLTCSARFGYFYAINTVVCLEHRRAATMTVGELAEAISHSRRRLTAADRAAAWSADTSSTPPNVILMKQLRTGGTRGPGTDTAPLSRATAKRWRIACAFMGGTSSWSDMDRLVDVAVAAGFVLEQPGEMQPLNSRYKVTLNSSAAYIVNVALDDEFKLVSIRERALAWVHGTLLGATDAPAHDVRLRVDTHATILPSSNLYKFALGAGPPVLANPDPSDPRPLPSHNKISCVRVVHSRVKLPHARCSGVLVRIATGTEYEGKDIQTSRPFCELSVLASPAPVQEWLRGQGSC
ncbi:hypothetical protein DYB30_007578, partial [Aphanomyces astaci]